MKPASGWLDALPSDRLLAEFSLWSADLGRLADEMTRVDPFVDIYHIDVTDGHFSPDLLFFPDLVAIARKVTTKPLHVHLMATDDILHNQIRQFADVGTDLISIHAENREINAAVDLLEQVGVLSGLVLQLHTPVAAVARHLGRIQLLTLLGTRIGIKGQGLDPTAEARMREARTLIAERTTSRRLLLAADGGIREHTVPGLRLAGAETIVMGSLAFNATDLPARMAWVRAQPAEA